MVLEAVDTEFAGHELAKSSVCGVWCGSCLHSPGNLGPLKQQVLWVFRTHIIVGLLSAALQLLRVMRQREHRDRDMANTRGTYIYY